MAGVGEYGFDAEILAHLHNACMVCRHDHTRCRIGCVGLHDALGHAHHHGDARDVGQGFFRQAGAVQPRRDQYGVRHVLAGI